MKNYENLNPDMLVEIGLLLEIDEIVTYCLLSKKFNTFVCNNRFFWLMRLRQDYDITKEYIPSGSTPKAYYDYVYTAIRVRNKNILDELLKTATKYNNIRLAEIVLDAGADIDGTWGYPIKQSIVNGNIDMIKFLVSRGANYNIHGGILISIASRVGELDIVKYLVELGVTYFRELERALERAIINNHLDVVKYLVEELGAQVQDKYVKMANYRGYSKIVEYLTSKVN